MDDARPGELDTISYRGPLLAELIAASVEVDILDASHADAELMLEDNPGHPDDCQLSVESTVTLEADELELVASQPIESTVVLAGSRTMSIGARIRRVAASGVLPLPATFFPRAPSTPPPPSGSSMHERSYGTMPPVAYAIPSAIVEASPPRKPLGSHFAFTLGITGLALVLGGVIGVGVSQVRAASAAEPPRLASRSLVAERTPLAGVTRDKAARAAPRLSLHRTFGRPSGTTTDTPDKPAATTIELGSGAGSSGSTAAALLGSSDSR